MYKTKLSAASGLVPQANELASNIIRELAVGEPGYEFEFEFPRFSTRGLREVEIKVEAWGNELLQRHRIRHYLQPSPPKSLMYLPDTTSASYEIVRHDWRILSIKYRVNAYHCGAAHGSGWTQTYTYMVSPLVELDLVHLLNNGALPNISELCRKELMNDGLRSIDWVNRGTEPKSENFSAFNITDTGLLITFDEYRVDCYAAGPQIVELSFKQISPFVRQSLWTLWQQSREVV